MANIVINKTAFLDAPITVDSLHGMTFTNESGAHQFVISAMQGGNPLALTGGVSARFMRANNTTILLTGSVTGGKAVITLHQDCYNVPGRFQLAIFNTVSGTTTCIYAAIGTVQRTVAGELIDSGEAVPDISDLLAQIDACEQATAAANAAATKAVRYDTAQTLTETQKAQARANVDGASVGDVNDLKSALHSELHENTVSNSLPFEIVTGYQINQTTGAFDEKSNWERSSYIDIDGGISIEVTTEYTIWNCAFYDASYAMLSFMSIYADTGSITIPSGAKYFAMSVASPRLAGVIVNVTKRSFNANIASEIATIRYEANNSLVDCPFSFVQGALNSNNGAIDSSSARRIASNFIRLLTEKMTVHVDNKYQSNVFFYSSETNGYLSNSGWTNGDYIIGDSITIPSGAKLIRITLRNKADTASDITPSTIQQGEFLIEYLAKKANEIELEKFEKLFVPSASPNIMYVCRDCRVRNDIPPNSKYAIKATAYNQYDRARFSVTKTTDGQYVAVHDVTINGLAVNSDGSAISTPINTADCSLAELNVYDWGLKYGAQYAGLKVPMLDDCLKLASIYNLGIVLDIKWTVTAEDIDALTVMLAKYGQTDAIFFAVNPINAALLKAKNPRFSYLYAGTYEQMQTQTNNLAGLLTGYNHVYLANRPLGTAPTSDIINYACANNFDIMYSPIEGISELIALGFDKGITLMECHYIENIKKSVMEYADSLV